VETVSIYEWRDGPERYRIVAQHEMSVVFERHDMDATGADRWTTCARLSSTGTRWHFERVGPPPPKFLDPVYECVLAYAATGILKHLKG
jgi:hypothetical protein